jgi:uncharacterized membrane protein
MAPIGALISHNPKSGFYTYPESSKIGGIIIAAILAAFFVAFICIFLYEYRKGSFILPAMRSLLTILESCLTAQIAPPILAKSLKV